jgi:hypothetical protein
LILRATLSSAEPQAPSRGVGDAGYTPPQWRSPHAGSPSTDAERDIESLNFMDPAEALRRYNAIVEEIEWKFNLSHSKAMDRARLHPLASKYWTRAHQPPTGEAEFKKRQANSYPGDALPTKWEVMVNEVLRTTPGVSQSKAVDLAMSMPGGKEAWLAHKARQRAA